MGTESPVGPRGWVADQCMSLDQTPVDLLVAVPLGATEQTNRSLHQERVSKKDVCGALNRMSTAKCSSASGCHRIDGEGLSEAFSSQARRVCMTGTGGLGVGRRAEGGDQIPELEMGVDKRVKRTLTRVGFEPTPFRTGVFECLNSFLSLTGTRVPLVAGGSRRRVEWDNRLQEIY